MQDEPKVSKEPSELQDNEALETEPANSAGVELELSNTTLVEISPGLAAVLGEVPEGLQLVDFGVVPEFDRIKLNQALGSMGNLATIGGNLAEASASLKGLYRLAPETMKYIQGGAQMATKDGAKLGALIKNGKIVGQARFVPATLTAGAALAAIGPTVAMMALQMQLSEISGLVQANLALTSQTLKTIKHEQWAELTGLSTSIEQAVSEATRVQAVSPTIWESIAGNSAILEKQLDQYRRNVGEHIKQLSQLQGSARRKYLEEHAEAILFDANALLISLKAYAGYQALRAARARSNAEASEYEAKLVEKIMADTGEKFNESMKQAAQLVRDLTRELRIIALLPGRATLPLTKNRREARAARLTCQQLLDAIQPLADYLNPPAEPLTTPDVTCMPENIDIDQYLKVLRWLINDDETLRAIAFPYEPGKRNLSGAFNKDLKRLDNAWSALDSNAGKAFIKKATPLFKKASPILIAVTDRRIIIASPNALLTQGQIRDSIPLKEIQFVRSQNMQNQSVRPTIDVITTKDNLLWMFPKQADPEHVELFSQVIDRGNHPAQKVGELESAEV